MSRKVAKCKIKENLSLYIIESDNYTYFFREADDNLRNRNLIREFFENSSRGKDYFVYTENYIQMKLPKTHSSRDASMVIESIVLKIFRDLSLS